MLYGCIHCSLLHLILCLSGPAGRRIPNYCASFCVLQKGVILEASKMSLFQAVVQGTFGSICDEKLVLPGAPSIPPLSFTVHFLSSCMRNLIASRSCIRTRRRRWRTRRKAWTMKSTHSSRGRRRLNCSSLRPSRQEDHKL